MTPEEVVRNYNQAANKQKQIKILADLNMTKPSEIKAILAAVGVEGVEAPKRIRRKAEPLVPKTEDIVPEIQHSVPAANPEVSIYDRIEAVLNAIPADSSDRVCGAVLDMVTAMFQDYVIKRFKNTKEDSNVS